MISHSDLHLLNTRQSGFSHKVWLWLDQAVTGHWPLGSGPVQTLEETQRRPGATFYEALPSMMVGLNRYDNVLVMNDP